MTSLQVCLPDITAANPGSFFPFFTKTNLEERVGGSRAGVESAGHGEGL